MAAANLFLADGFEKGICSRSDDGHENTRRARTVGLITCKVSICEQRQCSIFEVITNVCIQFVQTCGMHV